MAWYDRCSRYLVQHRRPFRQYFPFHAKCQVLILANKHQYSHEYEPSLRQINP
jgi:hypothetical protein